MRVEKTQHGSVLAVKVQEPKIYLEISDQLKTVLQQCIDDGFSKIVLNLSEVEYMDSTGLSALLTARKALENKGELALCHLQESVKDLLAVTKLNQVFKIHQNEQEAVQALS